MNDRLSWGKKIGYGTGTLGKSLSYGLANGFIMLYFVSVLRLDTGFLAVMFFLARIWDGVNDLVMGAIIDSTKSKMGKFRPWIITGAVLNAFAVVALFYSPGFIGIGLYIYATLVYLLWDATYTMVDVGYWAMIPALTLDSGERDQVSMIPRIFGGAMGIIGAFTLQIVDKLGGQTVNGGFLMYAIVTGVAYIVTAAICVAVTKERILPAAPKQEKFSLIKSAKILFSNDQALVIVVIMILFNLAINLTNSVSVFYFKFVLNSQDKYSFFSILLGAAQTIGLFGFPFFSKWFGRDRVYKYSMVLPCIGYMLMACVNALLGGAYVPFLVAAFVMSIGFGSMSVMQNVMLADAVDYGEWKTGERSDGVIFSMLTFLSKVATALSMFITLIGFKIVGFGGEDATYATPQAVKCIETVMFIIPPIILLLALLTYVKKFKLKPVLTGKISAELIERRNGN